MKTIKRFEAMRSIGIIAVAAVMGFTFAALSLTGCDTDDGGGGGPRTVTYTGTGSDGAYKLEIKESASRAAYAPKAGDQYKLTLNGSNGKSSAGYVDDVDGDTITLKPEKGGDYGTAAVTVSDEGITNISGNGFQWDDGSPLSNPGTITPSGGPGTVTPPSGGGASLSFTNEQVYIYGLDLDEILGGEFDPNDMFTYRNYTGSDTLTSNVGGSGKITSGKMSFSVGTPPASALEDSDEDSILALKEYYSTVRISDTNARGVTLMITTSDGKLLQRENQQGMEAIMSGSGTLTTESVFYFYSDRAYTMQLSGGKNISEDPNYTFVMPDMNLTCKAGWNTMYLKMTMTVINEDITNISMDIKMGDLKSCKWVLTDDYSGGGAVQ